MAINIPTSLRWALQDEIERRRKQQGDLNSIEDRRIEAQKYANDADVKKTRMMLDAEKDKARNASLDQWYREKDDSNMLDSFNKGRVTAREAFVNLSDSGKASLMTMLAGGQPQGKANAAQISGKDIVSARGNYDQALADGTLQKDENGNPIGFDQYLGSITGAYGGGSGNMRQNLFGGNEDLARAEVEKRRSGQFDAIKAGRINGVPSFSDNPQSDLYNNEAMGSMTDWRAGAVKRNQMFNNNMKLFNNQVQEDRFNTATMASGSNPWDAQQKSTQGVPSGPVGPWDKIDEPKKEKGKFSLVNPRSTWLLRGANYVGGKTKNIAQGMYNDLSNRFSLINPRSTWMASGEMKSQAEQRKLNSLRKPSRFW